MFCRIARSANKHKRCDSGIAPHQKEAGSLGIIFVNKKLTGFACKLDNSCIHHFVFSFLHVTILWTPSIPTCDVNSLCRLPHEPIYIECKWWVNNLTILHNVNICVSSQFNWNSILHIKILVVVHQYSI